LTSLLTIIPGYDAGQCFDYDISPYIVAIVPQPVDYFMSCMHTYDCRAKCSDEIQSFEEALASTITPPVFTDELDFMVDSRFFSDLDVEEGRDQLPFHAYGMQELSTDACKSVCEHSLRTAAGIGGCQSLHGINNMKALPPEKETAFKLLAVNWGATTSREPLGCRSLVMLSRWAFMSAHMDTGKCSPT
jgi:hypothetical protein